MYVEIAVADLLGRHILPGIAALTADWMPKRDMQLLVEQAKRQAASILGNADRAYYRLKSSVEVECLAIKLGGLFTLPLALGAEVNINVVVKAGY